LNLQQYL